MASLEGIRDKFITNNIPCPDSWSSYKHARVALTAYIFSPEDEWQWEASNE